MSTAPLLVFLAIGVRAEVLLGGPITDVEVLLIPRSVSDGPDFVPNPADLPTAMSSLDRTLMAVFVLEIWMSDVGATNTGIVAAYFNVQWNTVIPIVAQPIDNSLPTLNHSSLYGGFLSGTEDNALGRATDFGGSDFTFSGLAIQPAYVRLGHIGFDAVADGMIEFSGVVGSLGVGVLGRIPESVNIAPVSLAIVPEPTSLGLISLAFVFLRRRRRERDSPR
ncbi:MAG TPA: PEP-CTERM sorting domain-containing protein [Phycisphaerae bacterium]|nr:PEP-CTERM sorting domain-containing protein [Phycisphaerae bacterium]